MLQSIETIGQEIPVLDSTGRRIKIGDRVKNGAHVYTITLAWEECPGYWHLHAPAHRTTMSGREGAPNRYHYHQSNNGALIDNIHVDSQTGLGVSEYQVVA
jgi:hypothetical protein